LPGSREDALESLPAFCEGERLELDDDRVSLVCARTRVDIRVIAETGVDGTRAEAPLTLLELAFEGRSEAEADAFVQRYRHRAHLRSHCH